MADFEGQQPDSLPVQLYTKKADGSIDPLKSDGGSLLTSSEQQGIILSLVETLQELISRLSSIANCVSVGPAGLRVIGVSMPSTAVTGPLTSAQSIAQKALSGVMYTQRTAMENIAAQANINNCIGA